MIPKGRIEELWYTGKSNAELCALLGVTEWGLAVVKRRHGLPNRIAFVTAAANHGPRPGDPDEEAIAAHCLKIQEGWSDEERERRRNAAVR